MIEEAAALSEEAAKATGDEGLMIWPLAVRGQRAEARAIVARLEKRATEGTYPPYWMASAYSQVRDADNAFREGEMVRIEECAPISKQKSWTVLERVGAAAAVIETPEAKKAEKPVKASKDKAKAESEATEA